MKWHKDNARKTDDRSNNFGAVGCLGSNESDVSVSQTSQLTVMANLSKSRRNSTHETDKCVLSISCWCAFAERKNKHTGVPTVRYTSHDVFSRTLHLYTFLTVQRVRVFVITASLIQTVFNSVNVFTRLSITTHILCASCVSVVAALLQS